GLARAGGRLLGSPWGAMAAAAVLTVALQGSTATMGLALVALQQGVPGIPAASWVGYVAGANVGTSSTAFLAAGGGDRRGVQVAVAYLFAKLLVALPVTVFSGPIADACGALEGAGGAHRLALMHLAFNGAVLCVTLPLSGVLSRAVGTLVRHRGGASEPLGTLHLTDAALETREVALAQAHLELVRMAELVAQMVRAVPEVVRAKTPAPIEQVRRMDDRVDMEQAGLTRFLSRLSRRQEGGAGAEAVAQAMSIADDLENIGDIITKQVAALAEKRLRLGVRFSGEGLSEILGYHTEVAAVVDATVEALRTADRAKAYELAARREELAAREGALRRSHIERVILGRAESLDTSAIHLDLLYAIRRIHAHAMNVNMALVGRGER
ncbi:MAG: Na/Pi cotransporter family protein, partial [Planctomycetes bacterium]|nr:Na/Pi cotransporter family protein [Planctomycetota bacterium]